MTSFAEALAAMPLRWKRTWYVHTLACPGALSPEDAVTCWSKFTHAWRARARWRDIHVVATLLWQEATDVFEIRFLVAERLPEVLLLRAAAKVELEQRSLYQIPTRLRGQVESMLSDGKCLGLGVGSWPVLVRNGNSE